jgi:dolichol-phosphate mannosyltransferase
MRDLPVMCPRALAVIPTYQESGNIETVLRRLRRAAPDVDVLVVDDNSPDRTADIAEGLGRELGRIMVLRRPAKAGLGTAYRAGFDFGIAHRYDVLVQMDADLSHDPDALPRLLREVEGGAALAIGSRYVPGGSTVNWPARRRFLSRWGNRYVRRMLRLGVADATSGYRAFRTRVLRTVHYESTRATGYGFQIELAYRIACSGGQIAEVPIVFNDRTRGKSKMSARITGEALALVTWWAIRDRMLRRNGPALEQTPDAEVPAAA